MARVEDSSLHNFTTGEVVTESTLDQNFKVLQGAVNNNDKILEDLGINNFAPATFSSLLKTSTTFNQLKFGYVKQITDPLDTRITSLETAQTKPPIIEEITATTDGQTIFILAKNTYDVGKGEVEVEIDGVPQYSGEGFTETDPKTITLAEGVLTGTVVRVIISQTPVALSEKLLGYDNHFTSVDASLAELASEASTYSAKQVTAMSKLMNKMNNWQQWTVVCQGDSLTNGYDPVDADVRPYTADPTYSMGCSTDSTIASSTYPEILKAALSEAGHQATVIKRGYNGDTAALSLARWTTNPNADLHIIQLGTNDAYNSTNVTQNITDYFNLVKQILDWGSAVLISTPPKKRYADQNQNSYILILKELGKRLNIPVIETFMFHDGMYADDIYQSDGVHFNGKGYYALGAKMASVLTGIRTMHDPFKVKSGRNITPDGNYNHWTSRGSTSQFSYDANSPFGSMLTGTGVAAKIDAGAEFSFGFYADEDDLVLIPQFKSDANAQLRVELNYRADTPYAIHSLQDGSRVKPPTGTTFALGATQNNTNFTSVPLSNFFNQALRVTTRGYNSVQIKNQGTVTGQFVYFYGFQVVSYTQYLTALSTLKLISTDSFPITSKNTGYREWAINRTNDKFIIVPSNTADAQDWNWTNQFVFDYTGNFNALSIKEGGTNLSSKYAPIMVGAPASATAPGTTGQMAQDGSYLYICTATNTWKRVAIASW